MTKLQKMRKHAGVSQSQLSNVTGINYRTLQYYDQGRMKLDRARFDKIISIALALNCNIEDIVEDQEIVNRIKLYQEHSNQ